MHNNEYNTNKILVTNKLTKCRNV